MPPSPRPRPPLPWQSKLHSSYIIYCSWAGLRWAPTGFFLPNLQSFAHFVLKKKKTTRNKAWTTTITTGLDKRDEVFPAYANRCPAYGTRDQAGRVSSACSCLIINTPPVTTTTTTQTYTAKAPAITSVSFFFF